jgi:carbamoyl-phosphate synthase small subunit
MNNTAVLVLEDGTVFPGEQFGATGQTLGEAVFCTAMTGYQETLTDPSYRRQIVVAAAPQIGNTGWNNEDSESYRPDEARDRIWAAGYAIRDLARQASSWRAEGGLEDELRRQGIVGVKGVDTRTLVRTLRNVGSMKAGIFSGDALTSRDEAVDIVRSQPSMAGADLVGEVTTPQAYVVEPDGEARFSIAALDLGIKTMTPKLLAQRGVRVHVLPASTSYAQIKALDVDGLFASNGPGDPSTAAGVVETLREALGDGLPFFGICLGNQLLGRALGLSTYKMKFGHRGINIPVIEHATGRVIITAQNHGFALEGEAGQRFHTPFGEALVTHTCANDGTVEGVALANGRAFSMQYHPEAAAGPHDAGSHFDQFVGLLGT